MTVKRIISNIKSLDLTLAQVFYGDFLGLEMVMDHDWIKSFTSKELMHPQISIASEGWNTTDLPDLSIEVDNVDELYEKAKQLDLVILYPLCDEEWGVRRFYVKDPFGKIVNILQHQ